VSQQPKRRVVLHAGLPKTGTTALQAALGGLRHPDFSYADLRHSNHSIPLILHYTRDHRRAKGYPRVAALNGVVAKGLTLLFDRAFRKAFNSSTQTLVISAESTFVALKEAELIKLRDDLRAHFERTEIIVYVRPLESSLSSSWQQKIRRGGCDLGLSAPPYRRWFEPAIRVFGRDAFNFRPFDRSQLIGGDLIQDFSTQIGLTPALVPTSTRFASLSLEAAAALYAQNRDDAKTMNRRSALRRLHVATEALQGFGQTPISFSRDMVERVLSKAKSDLEWMSDLVGFDVIGSPLAAENPIESEQQILELAARLAPETSTLIGQASHLRNRRGWDVILPARWRKTG
jgi:hypothetical protein